MNPKLKAEIISFSHTFIAVFGFVLVTNLNSFDFTTISRESVISFIIAVVRSAIKLTWNKTFPKDPISI